MSTATCPKYPGGSGLVATVPRPSGHRVSTMAWRSMACMNARRTRRSSNGGSGGVEVKPVLLARAALVQHGAQGGHLRLQVCRDDARKGDVEGAFLQAEQFGGVLGHVEPVNLIDRRAAAVVILERPEDDLLARQAAVKIERPGAHRVPAELVAERQRRLLADDVALLVADHAQRERRDRTCFRVMRTV